MIAQVAATIPFNALKGIVVTIPSFLLLGCCPSLSQSLHCLVVLHICKIADLMFFCIIGVSFTLGKGSSGTGMPRNWKFKKCDISDHDLDKILSCTTDYDISDLELQHLTLKCITLQRGSQPCLTCHTRSLSAGTSLITWCLSIQWRSWIGFVLGKSKTISIPLTEHSLKRKRS